VCYIVDYFLLMENWVNATTVLDTRISYHYQIIVCSFLVHQFTILLHFFKMWNNCAFSLGNRRNAMILFLWLRKDFWKGLLL
jgi:hypothetical protein